MSTPTFDAVVIGAGAAGLFCAGVAGQLGLSVLVLDHAEKIAEKIRISGGGRCNFTNMEVSATNFLSANPRFAKSALARYTPSDFIALLKRHQIKFHEKHKGQLFCDRSSEDIIELLLAECAIGGAQHWQPCAVREVRFTPMSDGQPHYTLGTDRGTVQCKALVIATGGLSIPKIGATDFGYRVARQFGLNVVDTRPALVPLTFDQTAWSPFGSLAGLSLPVEIATVGKNDAVCFFEDLLFTHRGLSGPGVLQISSYWRATEPIVLNLSPRISVSNILQDAKAHSRKLVANELAAMVPARLADVWVDKGQEIGQNWRRPINEVSDKSLAILATQLCRWEITPLGTEGFQKAEVTAGGVDTRQLSGKTMESSHPGLYFVGEVVDVTGWLGGYNFQWAWSSAFACAHGMSARLGPAA